MGVAKGGPAGPGTPQSNPKQKILRTKALINRTEPSPRHNRTQQRNVRC